MPILSNARHEKFAQAIAQGASVSSAYVTAGYPPHGSNAGRLSKKEPVRQRVEELQRAGAERAGVSVERIVSALADIAFPSAQGLTEEKTVDRLSALEKLGKHLGMFKDKDGGTTVQVVIDRRDARFL